MVMCFGKMPYANTVTSEKTGHHAIYSKRVAAWNRHNLKTYIGVSVSANEEAVVIFLVELKKFIEMGITIQKKSSYAMKLAFLQKSVKQNMHSQNCEACMMVQRRD